MESYVVIIREDWVAMIAEILFATLKKSYSPGVI